MKKKSYNPKWVKNVNRVKRNSVSAFFFPLEFLHYSFLLVFFQFYLPNVCFFLWLAFIRYFLILYLLLSTAHTIFLFPLSLRKIFSPFRKQKWKGGIEWENKRTREACAKCLRRSSRKMIEKTAGIQKARNRESEESLRKRELQKRLKHRRMRERKEKWEPVS